HAVTINAGDGSDIKLDKLQATNLNLKSGGGADVVLSGTVDSFTLKASGGSDVDARYLTASTCDASSTGASDVTVKVLNKFKGHVSGASDLTYYGNPTDVQTSGEDVVSDISKG